MENINQLPSAGFIRLSQILSFIPVSKTTWWDGVRSGRYPKGVALSSRTTAWRAEDIQKLILDLGKQVEDQQIDSH